MNDLLVFEIAMLFVLRIGLPVLVLVALGVVVDRWQSNRDNHHDEAS